MREKFAVTSDQMELLLAFEKAGDLDALSIAMAKDSSVISRRLKELAGITPAILKVSGRWQLTSLGRRLNALARRYLAEMAYLVSSGVANVPKSIVPAGAMLIVINAQRAMRLRDQDRRNNPKAEENLIALLRHWRKHRWPVLHVLHVRHVSSKVDSLFYKSSPSSAFIEGIEPKIDEITIEKRRSSAFTKTALKRTILASEAPAIVLVGFTANDCIDATARHAKDLDFSTFVIADATATFDITGPSGRLHKADSVHRATLANLHANAVEVIEVDSVLVS